MKAIREKSNFAAVTDMMSLFGTEMTAGAILLILVTQFIAGAIKAAAGFGNGAISGPILALRFDVSQVTVSNGIIDLPMNGYFALKFRRHYRVKKYILLSLAVAAGGIAGAFLLNVSPPKSLKILVGCFVIFLALRMLLKKQQQRPQKRWLTGVVLFLGGVAGGVFGMNVFFIPHFKRMAQSYEEFKGSICFTYALDLLIRIPIYFAMGTVTSAILPIALVSAVGLFSGIAVGNVIAKHLAQEKAELIAVIIMMLGGVSLIVKTLL